MRLRWTAVVLVVAGCGDPCLDTQPDGTHLRTDDPAETLDDFVAHPWPSDALVTRRGLSLSHFPNPTMSSTLEDYLRIISMETDAFGTSSAAYLGFTGALDPASLGAGPHDTVGANASLFLIDIDAASLERGRRVPVGLTFRTSETLYLGTNHLVVLPPYGVQLRGDTAYALIVTDGVRDTNGASIVASKNAHNAMYAGCEASTPARIFSAFEPLRTFFDDTDDLDRDAIVGATVFTTQGAVRELRELAEVARAEPPLVPVNWTRVGFNGRRWRYDAVVDLPGFQAGEIPYESLGDGGALARDEAGRYTVTHTERTRVGFSVPNGPTPAGGWPVVLYSHGTGGSFENLFNGDVADLLALRGVAAVSYDQTLHGPRAPAGTDPEITFFNLFNPVAARDNIRQGAADGVVLNTMITNLEIPAAITESDAVRFDPSRIAFLGHSQGGLVGAGLAAVDERVRAYVFSGLGAILSITLQERKDIIDFKGLLESLLQFPDGETLDDLHPVLNLIQTFIDRADPIAYASSYLSDPPKNADRDFLQVEGFLDFASPARGQEAFAVAARFPLVAPFHRVPAAAEFVGLGTADAPAIQNVATPAGNVTAGLIQYPEETHFPIFDNDDARSRYLGFIESALLEGRAQIGAAQP